MASGDDSSRTAAARRGLAACVVLVAACAFTLGAAAEKQEVLQLPEEVVVAPYQAGGLLQEDRTASVTVVTVRSPPATSDVGETLDGLMGVHVSTLGGLGKLATMSIRGSSGKQVAVFLDGIRLSGATGAVDLSTLPLSHFERIEILRGSAGARFGDAAMGGVVNLRTQRGKSGSWGSVALTGGLFTGRRRGGPADVLGTSVSVGHGAEKWDFLTAFEALWTNGKFIYEPDPALALGGGDRVRENNGLTSGGALLKGRYFPSESWELYTLGSFFLAEKEIPGVVSFPTPAATQRDRRLLAALGARSEGFFLQDLMTDARVSVHSEGTRYQDPEGGTTSFPITSENELTTVSTDLSGDLALGSTQRLSLSCHARQEGFTDRQARHRRSTAFASLHDELVLFHDRVVLSGALGGEISTQGGALGAVSGGGLWKALRFGAGEDGRAELSLRTSAGTAFRRPTFFELYYDQGFYLGNPQLDPERSASVDVGPVLALQLGKEVQLKASATYFFTRYEDLIVYVLQSGFRYRPFNVGKAQAEGCEIGTSFALGERLSVEAAWTYNEVLDKTREATHRNRQLPGIPRNQVRFRVEGRLWGMRPFVEYHFVGRNPVTRAGTKLLSQRHIVHAALQYELSQSLAAEVTVKNLTDERPADVRGFPLPSRTVYLTVRYTW